MKRILVLILCMGLFGLSGCWEKDFASNYDYVIWESTEESDMKIKIYVLDFSGGVYSEVEHLGKIYHFQAMIGWDLTLFEIVDEDGKVPNGLGNEIDTGYTILDENKQFKNEIHRDEIFDGYYKGKTVILEKKALNKDELTSEKISSVMYVSKSYELEVIMYSGYVTIADGTIKINGEYVDVRLCFLSDTEFVVYKIDDQEEVYLKGTYINEWLDVKLTITENNIDDKTSMELTGEQGIYIYKEGE